MELETLITLWRAALEVDHADRTVRSYVDHLRDFVHILPEPSAAAITAPRIEAYRRTYGAHHGPKTVGLALTSIRSFCRWLIACDLRADDPTLKVRFPRPPKSLPRALADEQVRELLAALVQPDGLTPVAAWQWRRNRLAIHLMLYAGLRISEVRELRQRDVLLAQQKIVIRAAKGDKDRTVPLHQILLGELRLAAAGRGPNDAVCGHPTGETLAEKSLNHMFERWVPRLGLSFHFTSHQLRHTFCTKLIDRGAGIFEAQELMGHESPETTRIYYRLSGEHLRTAIDRLPAMW